MKERRIGIELFVLILLHLLARCLACTVQEEKVSYDQQAVDLVFTIDICTSSEFGSFSVYNENKNVTYVNSKCIFGEFGHTSFMNGAVSIGNPASGNISFRIPSIDVSKEGNYVLEGALLGGSIRLKCIQVIIRGLGRLATTVLSITPNSNTNVRVNSSLEITCSYNNQDYHFIRWALIRSGSVRVLGNTNKTCHIRGSALKGPDYNVTCPKDGQQNLTINQVKLDNHGDTYYCEQKLTENQSTFQSNNLTVYVTVPVNYVQLLNSSSADVAVIEGNITEFVCRTSACRPNATIYWYKKNGDTIKAISDNIATVYIESNRLSITQSTLKLFVNRNDNGYYIYCGTNNTEPNMVESSHRTRLNVHYHPIAELSDGGEVEEGQPKTFLCVVDSKPFSNITWYHNSSILSSGNTVSGNKAVYIIPIVDRAQTGLYRCRAENGYNPSAEKSTYMVVNYAPDVEVATTKITVKNESAVLNCKAFGVPDTYTFSEWQHIWPGHGIITHTRSLGNSPQLTLTNLTYEYSGIYKCSVSNGIKGSRNPNAGYGKMTLQVMSPPVVTTIGIPKIPSRLNVNCTFTIEYYSSIEVNNLKCFRNNTNVRCSVSESAGEIKLPVFGTTIKTVGVHANITLTITEMVQFGIFTLRIENWIGSTEKSVELVPQGPEVPMVIRIEEVTVRTITISWVPGFHGGFDQTFLIQHKIDSETWHLAATVHVTGPQREERVNTTIRDLSEGTLYFIRIKSQNILGDSDFIEVNVTTSYAVKQDKASSSSLPVIAGAVAGGVLCVVFVAFALLFVCRQKLKNKGEDGMHVGFDGHVYENTANDVHLRVKRIHVNFEKNQSNVGETIINDNHEHDKDERSTYETLQQNAVDVHEYGTLSEALEASPRGNTDEYVNLRLSPLR